MTLHEFSKMLKGRRRLLTMPIEICLRRYGEQYKVDAGAILSFVGELADHFRDEYENIIDDYLKYVEQQIKLQKKFQNEGPSCFDKEQAKGIANSNEFQKRYLYTLGLSYVLAPHRYDIFRYIRSYMERFVKHGARCLEVGTGTGLDSLAADSHGALVDTYDLNPYSRVCLEILRASQNVRFFQETYQFDNEARYDHCILVELLEHLENPLHYLLGAKHVLKKGGTAILTFAIRMPQFDHIYPFNSVTQAREMVSKVHFEMIDQDYFISSFMNYDPSNRENLAESSKYAANYVCVVRKD